MTLLARDEADVIDSWLTFHLNAGADFVVCTLKDAVKLKALWPDKAPALMYVSQRVELMSGEGHLQAALDRLLAARTLTLSTTAG